MYSKEFIHRQVSRLADACGKPVSARVRITFFRKGEGMIHPVSNDADFFIEMSELAAQYFYSTEGISLVLLNEPLKCTGLLANIKSCNALPQVIASVYRDAQGADDCLLLNSHYRICETISSNIFLLQGISAYTPPITEGCVQGVMRQHVMRLLRELSFNIAEEKLEVRDLHTAETVLLTNVIQGINWVREFEGKRYDSGNCAELVRHLNNRLEA
jgi:branched-chain amino acid aminotransferase